MNLQNVGETAWLQVTIRAWVAQTGTERPSPQTWADTIESSAVAVQDGVEPHFVGSFNALGVNQARWDLLRWGPRANEYHPAWAGAYGIVIWDVSGRDLYGRTFTGSGHTDVEPKG